MNGLMINDQHPSVSTQPESLTRSDYCITKVYESVLMKHKAVAAEETSAASSSTGRFLKITQLFPQNHRIRCS